MEKKPHISCNVTESKEVQNISLTLTFPRSLNWFLELESIGYRFSFLHSDLICLLIEAAVKAHEGLGHPDWYRSHRVQTETPTQQGRCAALDERRTYVGTITNPTPLTLLLPM